MTRKSALCLALAAAFPAGAVTLNPDGLGQALIYPYYTVQSTGTDAYNTYISVVNHSADAKAVRVRFREGRLGKEALALNLFLSPNDVWTAALVPSGQGTRLMSTDRSCTEPALPTTPGAAPGIDFPNFIFTGVGADTAGDGLDRTREGFVEIIEMGTLTGASAAAATPNSAGVPSNCAALLTGTPSVAAPAGNLSGTLTIINVATGMDFSLNAEALDNVAQRPYYRPSVDPYVAFTAAEIDPVSVVTANGTTWRSLWDNPVDAVSAVLMREHAYVEYVLDQATASLTDVVMTLPTRHFHANATASAAPFTAPAQWAPTCLAGPQTRLGEPLLVIGASREAQTFASSADCGFPECPALTANSAICAASGVFTVRNNALLQFVGVSTDRTALLGSITRGAGTSAIGTVNVVPTSSFSSGWLDVRSNGFATLVSRAQSSRLNTGTGEVTAGAHAFKGLPMVGFSARVFRNGTLRCDAGSCLGNYGGAFPFKYRRNIAPAS